jgi:hypothetical protein
LHIPAAKAMALAAMPTAVVVGLSLTPGLAQADEIPGNPFAPGPCVTRSDEPGEEASASASESAKPSGEPSSQPSPSETGSAYPAVNEPKAAVSPADGSDEPSDEERTSSPEPEPTTSGTISALDPRGIGDTLTDLVDGPGEEPSPSASSSTPEPEPTSGTPMFTPDETSDKPADAVQDTTKEAIKEAAAKAGATVEEIDDAAKDTARAATDDAKHTAGTGASERDADGKEPFPCPTADPEELAAAELEQGMVLLPDEPWRLETSMLTLRDLDYHGIVEVRTYTGKVKKVLKFTAEEMDIKDLHQLVVGPQDTTAHVEAAKGSTSTIRDGTVTMYTEELKGDLFGAIPVTFSPESPPPLNVPLAVFTDAKVKQAGQFGGTLTVPGLHSYSTGG